ncbi:MAG: anti-sigma factor antagonist [Coriobacteriia bacterium]|nr:anti-sigma factor antagonist [Coriobacteriia bacterium]MBN2821884.1 anti-sigma factor antagonist [Coriobacteriia bacterium]
MTIERGTDASVCVVRLRGEIDISTVPGLRNSIESVVLAGCVNVVLDLAEVVYADSSALGLIVWLDHLLDPKHGKLVLASPSRDVARVLELSGLVGLAPTIVAAADVEAAVNGFDLSSAPSESLWEDSLLLHADVEALPGIRAQVCDMLKDIEISDASMFDIRVAVGEALANAVRHGSPGGHDDDVLVSVSVFEDRVAIKITDSGAGFDGSANADGDLYAASGRGVMFMRALMDQVEFCAAPGGGTAVTLVKHLDAGSGTK